MKKTLLGLLFLALSGCYSTPTPSTPETITTLYYAAPTISAGVVQLRTETVLDANSTRLGIGSAFAVSPKVILTALHCVDEFTSLKVNGYKLDVVKVVPFGEDGAAVVVSNMPKWMKIFNISDDAIRGTAVMCYGYDPDSNIPVYRNGVVTAPGIMSALIYPGMSGGPVVSGNKVIGINSAVMPTLGISRYEIIPIDIVRSLERTQ